MVKVSKFYDKKRVLKDIYLSFFFGAKIGVLGLNGAGKSSLLRIIPGTDKELNGEVVFQRLQRSRAASAAPTISPSQPSPATRCPATSRPQKGIGTKTS